MALPKLDTPTYELEQPSTGEKIKYRPFLVKEQKTLMMAQESGDDKQVRDALASLITGCTFEIIDPYKVPIFDVEFLFLRIRGKSVGEKIDLNLLCPDDNETEVSVIIPLDEIKIKINPDHNKDIKLDDNLVMRMRYPSLSEFVKTNFDSDDEITVDQSFDLIALNYAIL